MEIISRRDALRPAAAGVASVSGLAANAGVAAGQARGEQGETDRGNRSIGPDPHAQPDPEERHAIVAVRDNLDRFEVGRGRARHSSLFLVTKAGIILTDPIRTSAARWLRGELRRRFAEPVKYVIYSHGHFDHIGGGQLFQEDGAAIVAHENAVEPIVGERLPTAVPDETFGKDRTLAPGGEQVELTFVAPSHSNSMIMIHFPKQRAMMAVDVCPVGALPYNDLLDFYYDGWMESLRRLGGRDFDILEGGHYDLGTKLEVGINVEYMQSLHDQVPNLVRAGQSRDQLWRQVKLDKFKDRIGYADMRVLNVEGMFRWVSNHRRVIW